MDGAVGLIDFAIFAKYYLKPPGPSGLDCAGTEPCPKVGAFALTMDAIENMENMENMEKKSKSKKIKKSKKKKR